jgi:hypothetical protein
MPRISKPAKTCDSCKTQEAIKGEKYCKSCKKAVLTQLKQAGYLREAKEKSAVREQKDRSQLSLRALGGTPIDSD